MPGKRVAMVTGPGWTPRGHFDLTEWMSPVCVRECACLATGMAACQKRCVCVCCLHEFVTLQSALSLQKLLWWQLCYFPCCFAKEFLFCNVSSFKLWIQRGKPRWLLGRNATFCLLISYINSSCFFPFSHQSFCSGLSTKPALSRSWNL